MHTEISKVPEAWALCQRMEEGSLGYVENVWALNLMGRLMVQDPATAWLVVEAIYEQFHDDAWVMENLGAGPVETLLRRQESVVLPLLRSYLESHAEFREVLDYVWTDSLGAETLAVLSAAAK